MEDKIDKQEVEHLLSSITHIRLKYDEIAKITGENFNIFSVLRLDSDEVRLHSRLIGELLKPDGTHGQNGTFLKLFLSLLNIDKHTDEQINKAKIFIEENIGNVPDDYSKGGRIDIVIKIENREEIVIENKIFAGDQPKQLWRYRKEYPKAHIIYLTPFQDQPHDDSPSSDSLMGNKEGEGIKREEIIYLNYHTDIKNWISLCLKEVHNLPLLREILNHYINLINKLTHQTMNKHMENDIINLILKNPQHIQSVETIAGSWEIIKDKIISQLTLPIQNIAEKLNLKVHIEDKLGQKETGFWFYRDEWCYCICYYFETKHDKILLGIDNKSNESKCSLPIFLNMKEHMRSFNSNLKPLNYENWMWVSDFSDWSNTNWKDISSKIPSLIEERTINILSHLEKFSQN